MHPLHGMSRRVAAGLAFTAGCLLTACQTVAPPGLDTVREYAAAPASRLVSRRDLQFKVAEVEQGTSRLMVLAYQAPGGKPSPVAALSSSRSGDETHVSVQRLPLPEAGDDQANLDVAAIEHLYTLVMRQDPEARFCLTSGNQRCNAAKDGHSHSALLQELARARQQAAGGAGRTTIPWHIVSLAPSAMKHADSDEVSVRITSDLGTMEGVTVYFNQAPHSSCVAKSGEGGVAACHLVDQHGDDASHAGHEKAPVVATFPGDVRVERILLPTTLVQSPAQ